MCLPITIFKVSNTTDHSIMSLREWLIEVNLFFFQYELNNSTQLILLPQDDTDDPPPVTPKGRRTHRETGTARFYGPDVQLSTIYPPPDRFEM